MLYCNYKNGSWIMAGKETGNMPVSSGIDHAEQQRLNRALVIDSLRRQGCCSRAELARLTNLKRATITNIIGEFIDLGLVVETEFLSSEGGRRSIGLRINGRRYQVIGVMITRKYYCIVRIGLSGEVYALKCHQIPAEIGVEDLVRSMEHNIHMMIAENPETRIMAIGFAVPGPYLQKEGEVAFITNLEGWDEFPISAKLQEAFDIPVLLSNDANAAAYASYWYDAQNEKNSNLVYIVAGQGIGCGLLSNGRLVQGAMGIAGEIGHTSIDFHGPKCACGNRGCLELYCSLLVLENRIKQRLLQGEASCLTADFTTRDLAEAIRQGDPLALEEYERNCGYLVVGIVNLINQFNPSTIVIGDQLVDLAPELLLRLVREQVRERLRPAIWEGLNIEVDQSEYNPIVMGAAALAAQTILEDPFSY